MLVVQTHAGRLGQTWHAPKTWSEATTLLTDLGPESAAAGGATYLMWRAAQGEPMPRHLVSLHRIVAGRQCDEGSLGALTTLRTLERDTRYGAQRALTMAASVTAGPAVRTVATLGGNLASGFPQADLMPALLALGADAQLSDGEAVPVERLLEQGIDRRLVTGVTHELTRDGGWSGASIKLARRGMDLSVGVAAVAVRVEQDEIQEARVAVGSLHERPQRLTAIEAALVGADPSEDTIEEVLRAIGFTGQRFQDDAESTGTYRARIARPLVRKALLVALRLGPNGEPERGDERL